MTIAWVTEVGLRQGKVVITISLSGETDISNLGWDMVRVWACVHSQQVNFKKITSDKNLKMHVLCTLQETMETDDDMSYLETLQENYYLFCRYIVPEDFLEQLISEKVLSMDDRELITNQHVNQNRRQRTSK